MRLTHQYRLRLTKAQEATFEEWLELCRRQYNYRLAERLTGGSKTAVILTVALWKSAICQC